VNHGKFRIFHLEDDDNDAFLFAAALRRTHRACDLTRFNNGIEATQALDQIRSTETEAPHLIITDLKMPKMNGIEFVRWLRQSRFSCVPAILISGSSLAGDVLDAYRCGANSFSVKPVTTHELNELIGTVVKYWHDVSITPAQVAHSTWNVCSLPEHDH